jgi:glucosamine--fructose-6-phosphate aminotransferase (isomerizing)
MLIKKKGKVKVLQDAVEENKAQLDLEGVHKIHVGIAHTRWATHGVPSEVNSHPQRSGDDNDFIVVHNGILTNYKDVKVFLENKGFTFESETDTEVIAKLMKHLHQNSPKCNFRELVERTIQQLEGAFACCFKSTQFPGECVSTRRGSPLLVGIKTESDLVSDSIPIQFRLVLQNNATIQVRNYATFVLNHATFHLYLHGRWETVQGREFDSVNLNPFCSQRFLRILPTFP